MMAEARADLSDDCVAAELYSLVQAAYEAERRWIGVRDFPPLHESAEELRGCGEPFITIVELSSIVGALSYCVCEKNVRITRLVVRPDHFRKGIGSSLICALEARFPDAFDFHVVTAERNEPAIRLYAKLGYARRHTFMSGEGILLGAFRKIARLSP